MSQWLELRSSMTGSTRTGPLKPPVNSTSLKNVDKLSSSGLRRLDDETTILRTSASCKGQSPTLRKMTPARSPSGQPIQLTPLWEHVVRTRQFPSEVDTRETFDEITERLRDPEWEVRQHALRVLVDVLPTLDLLIIDEAMTTVLPELVNNLGHLAPAVRKGALDTLRVYLACSPKKDEIVKGILRERLIHQDSLDNFQTNVTLGVILSTPSLLFPSSSSSRPCEEVIKQAIGALANRLIQVTHQEASLRSLVKIHELLGDEFHIYLDELDMNARRDYEILCDVYKIKLSEKNYRRKSARTKSCEIVVPEPDDPKMKVNESEKSSENNDKICECGNEILEVEEKFNKITNSSNPVSRIVLETEIKLNEETAITMTIIEQKNEEIDEESDFENFDEFSRIIDVETENYFDERDDEMKDEWIERRKTPRRVHFGGEIVKLRTPDSDDSELVQMEILQTKIPIPIAPVTNSTSVRTRKSRSNPCSPNVVRSRLRKSKSVTNSPKREFYVHDGSLSPKKSILAKTGSNPAGEKVEIYEANKKKMEARVDTIFGKQEIEETGWTFEICDNDDFTDFIPGKYHSTKTTTNSKNNREASKKKNNSSKLNNDRSLKNENAKVDTEENPRTADKRSIDPDTNLEKTVSLKNSADSRMNRELSKKKKVNSAIMNDSIGKMQTKESNEIIERNSANISGDPNLGKISTPKKLSSPKKKRNSGRKNNEQLKNNEISSIEISARVTVENSRDLGKKYLDSFVNFSQENNDSTKFVTEVNGHAESPAKTLPSTRTNEAVTRNNGISEIQPSESVKVKSVELVKGSRIMFESSAGQASQDEKEERVEEPRVSSARTSEETPVDREVGEKFESTNDGNEKSWSVDFEHRISPRSPKKLVFETFPRKERNYILMELSSPVKTSSRRNSENFDEKQRLEITEKKPALSRDNSPMDSSLDRSIPEPREAETKIPENHQLSDPPKPRDSTTDGSSGKNDRNTTAAGEIKIEKSENFDLEESSLNAIAITENTKFRESNWEDLGLVNQDVLDDLHNKEDWRARVRGLERVASALRTSSALVAIEPRLGSLLQAVLGGERSCRVAAAGMAVARVVVAGVSEEALKRRLPQVAWGLARQGGPNAAQLARVAMLRLRPALLLEQLLQPHCIKARNAKTRENALQLLIFSLVTFPSTEFKVENVAYKVAAMVGDRRRRVRQAALDTLAVLAQIYEPEEVTKAGKLAAKGQQDGDAMLAAIRARLARKSLPMVSADGLVLYGLQISPNIQIATGSDVDWIVAGSGSVSPGTGRTRGQIIATTTQQGAQDKKTENNYTKNASGSKGPNFVALGVGLETKNEHKKPLAWQLVQRSAQDERNRTRENRSSDNRDAHVTGPKEIPTKSRLTGILRQYRSASDRLDDSFDSNVDDNILLIDEKDGLVKQRKTEENFHRRMDEIYAERTGIVPISRDVTGNRLESRIPVPQSRDRETNVKDVTRIGGIYPRTRLPQEGNNLENWSAGSRVSDISRPQSMHRDDHSQTDVEFQRSHRNSRDFSPGNFSRNRDTYRSIYRQARGFADGNVYREVQTAPTSTSYDVTRRRQSLKDAMATRYIEECGRLISNDSEMSVETMSSEGTARSRRSNEDRLGNSSFQNGDKSVVEADEYNEKNHRRLSVQANSYRIQSSNDRSSQCPGDNEQSKILEKNHNDRNFVKESFVTENDEIILPSPSNSLSPGKSFDVITHETNPSRRSSIDYGISSRNIHSGAVNYNPKAEKGDSESDKDSSADEIYVVPRVHSSHENFAANQNYENDSSETEGTPNCIDRNIDMKENDSSDGDLSKLSDDSPVSTESRETQVENLNFSKSASMGDSSNAIQSIEAIHFDDSSANTDENDGVEATMDASLEDSVRIISPRVNVCSPIKPAIYRRPSHEKLESRGREDGVISVLVASRPHSRHSPDRRDKGSIESFDFPNPQPTIGNSNVTKTHENVGTRLFVGKLDGLTEKPDSSEKLATEDTIVGPNFSRDSTNLEKINRSSNAGNEGAIKLPEIDAGQATISEKNEVQKRVGTSRVSRMRQKTRINVARVAPMQPSVQTNDRNTSKSKTLTQQCFTQLESNDWEVTMKGLKGLSQIARQQPEILDSCAPGTVGRLLGRHIRNLRSQVSRAACLAAGDVFGSQARCIDQDLDDIAGPLLHRTADTNKFLRADSNEALDRMVEHLSPNKTIVVIVHRGATHQNAIVRATTARLLASIVDRVGPDWTMSMPRDVREKLVATGAKLLMDGNLEARNQAKSMFRKLSRCEGFRKVLKDSVPDTTLRHIDKTLRSLQ